MTDHFNGLSEAEAERLAILIEECSEVQKAAAKILRHGWVSNGYNNRAELETEIGNIDAISARMVQGGDIAPSAIVISSRAHTKKLRLWTHHQPDSNYVGGEKRND